MREGPTYSFGCCTSWAQAFQEQEADGIMGMSPTSGSTLVTSHHHPPRPVTYLTFIATSAPTPSIAVPFSTVRGGFGRSVR